MTGGRRAVGRIGADAARDAGHDRWASIDLGSQAQTTIGIYLASASNSRLRWRPQIHRPSVWGRFINCSFASKHKALVNGNASFSWLIITTVLENTSSPLFNMNSYLSDSTPGNGNQIAMVLFQVAPGRSTLPSCHGRHGQSNMPADRRIQLSHRNREYYQTVRTTGWNRLLPLSLRNPFS